MNAFRKILFVFLGTLSLILGILGIVVPGLPVTPFLLLTSWLYIRSSERLYNRLVNNKILGKYIKRYHQNKGMTIKAKVYSIVVMWLMISISTCFFIENGMIKIIVVIVGLIGTIVMGVIVKTVKESNSKC